MEGERAAEKGVIRALARQREECRRAAARLPGNRVVTEHKRGGIEKQSRVVEIAGAAHGFDEETAAPVAVEPQAQASVHGPGRPPAECQTHRGYAHIRMQRDSKGR